MILDLKKIFADDGALLSIDYKLDMSDTEYMGDYPLTKPVSAVGTVSNSAGLVTLLLQLVFTYSAPCDRCGLPTDEEITVSVNKSLAPEIMSEDSDSIITVPDMKLDLDELIFSEVILSLPMKHLCRKDCMGICQYCGKNLNEGKCNCKGKEIDPRLSALADLLKD